MQHVEQLATAQVPETAIMILPKGMTSLCISCLNEVNDINIFIRNRIIRLEDAELATEAMACISGDRARIKYRLSFLRKRRDQDDREIESLEKEEKELPPDEDKEEEEDEKEVHETNSVQDEDVPELDADSIIAPNSVSEVQWESDVSEGEQEDASVDDTVIDYVEDSEELQHDTQEQDDTDTYPNKSVSVPRNNVSMSTSQRLPWSEDEVSYVTDWVRSNPYSPVRALYTQIMESPRAREIFAFRHISSIDRLDYQFKKVHKTLGLRN
jgi:hypothetical protein